MRRRFQVWIQRLCLLLIAVLILFFSLRSKYRVIIEELAQTQVKILSALNEQSSLALDALAVVGALHDRIAERQPVGRRTAGFLKRSLGTPRFVAVGIDHEIALVVRVLVLRHFPAAILVVFTARHVGCLYNVAPHELL